ncbi:MAG: hydroxymethylbilane synthase [bacterium]
MRNVLRIGTRRSPLAVWQAEHVKSLIERQHAELSCTLVRIVTQGDKIQDSPLAGIGGKGLFVQEIESALGRGEIDLAVHSMKDLPGIVPAGLRLAAVPPREDFRDALVCREPAGSLDTLPQGACVGTGSLRRTAQLRSYRKDLRIEPVRGNVETRLRKLDEGRFDAIVLAAAGLKRLGLSSRISELLEPGVCLPAIGQGVLAIEIREDDAELARWLDPLNHPPSAAAAAAERAFLAGMEGSCEVPVAGLAELRGPNLTLTGLIASLDGSTCIRRSAAGAPQEAATLGSRLAAEVRSAGGEAILAAILGQERNPP